MSHHIIIYLTWTYFYYAITAKYVDVYRDMHKMYVCMYIYADCKRNVTSINVHTKTEYNENTKTYDWIHVLSQGSVTGYNTYPMHS